MLSAANDFNQYLHFDPFVKNPAFPEGEGPVVLYDEAHFNHQTITKGRYRGLADVLANDGYEVRISSSLFSSEVLEGCDILIISNALNEKNFPWNTRGKNPPYFSAFTESEINSVHDWVWRGGGLLLLADHWPFGAAAEDLAGRFGVAMSDGLTIDEYENSYFTRINGKLLDHPVTRGRNEHEKINRIEIFGGQSLLVPEGSGFLRYSDEAYNIDSHYKNRKDVGGQYAGAGFGWGQGRVVVLAEAGMLCATMSDQRRISDPGYYRGMNPEKNDNKKLLLNIVHYLSGLIDE